MKKFTTGYCDNCNLVYELEDSTETYFHQQCRWIERGVPFSNGTDTGIFIFKKNQLSKKQIEAIHEFLLLRKRFSDAPVVEFSFDDCKALIVLESGRIVGLLSFRTGDCGSLAIGGWCIPDYESRFHPMQEFIGNGEGCETILPLVERTPLINKIKKSICRSDEKRVNDFSLKRRAS